LLSPGTLLSFPLKHLREEWPVQRLKRKLLQIEWTSPAVWVPLALLPLFWYFRSATFRGDGDQIDRMIEGGLWFWSREMLSQAILQAAYRYFLNPLLHWDGMLTMNLISALSGCFFFFYFIRLALRRWGQWKLPVLFFFSCGFTILFFGHTEYYPMAYAAAAGFFLSAYRYLSGRGTLAGPALWFSLLCWMHLLGFFIAPAILYLGWVRGRSIEDFVYGALGLIPAGLLYFFAVCDPSILDVSGPLAENVLIPPFDYGPPGHAKLFTFLSRGHIHSIFYWIVKATPLLIPMLLALFLKMSLREIFFRDPFVTFLWICGGLWFAWTLVWHPDFGIYQDWDLFSIAGLPLTLVALDHWIRRGWTRHRAVIPAILVLALFPTAVDVAIAAQLGHRGRGHLRIVAPEDPGGYQVKVDGHSEAPVTYNLLEGAHRLKIISLPRHQVLERVIEIRPGVWNEVEADWHYARRVDRTGDD